MRIKITSVMVDDQLRARKFYTDKLGFVIKYDVPMGDFNWLTVVSPEDDSMELRLEPVNFPPARVYQSELFRAGIAAAAFNVDNIEETVSNLRAAGVEISEPVPMGSAMVATLNDTCGNLISLYELDE